MRVEFSESGNFNNTKDFLIRASHMSPKPVMDATGRQIVAALRQATPRRTGKTANGWQYTITSTGSGYTLEVHNSSHPETSANVALLLDEGHGTRNGGYVPGRHYIRPASHGLLLAGADRLLKGLGK